MCWSCLQSQPRPIRLFDAAVWNTVISIHSPSCWQKYDGVPRLLWFLCSNCCRFSKALGLYFMLIPVRTVHASSTLRLSFVSAKRFPGFGITLNVLLCRRCFVLRTAVGFTHGRYTISRRVPYSSRHHWWWRIDMLSGRSVSLETRQEFRRSL